ncbi:MAG: hypothetical protein IJW04_08360 [Ruminococcus sp.]|nr:hypothetical protein [Ruminococcus sp.]
MDIQTIIALLSESAMLLAVLIPIVIDNRKSSNGTRCLLRSEMLRIYYHNKDSEKIRQYELENFVFLYEAYKKLKGNSFMDKICKEVMSWEVIT